MTKIIVISGPIGAGKSEFSRAVVELSSAHQLSTRQYILDKKQCPNERSALQKAGAELDEETQGAWILEAVNGELDNNPGTTLFLLDAARTEDQIQALRQLEGVEVLHTHLHAEVGTLAERYKNRVPELREFPTYEDATTHRTEKKVHQLQKTADLVLSTDHTPPLELAQTAIAFFGITEEKCHPNRMVDVIVGGQYGSEGKGNICAYIAKNYDVLVRIGGPNAGHCVAEPPYKYVQLPSGTGSNPQASIMIGAGSTIWLPRLLEEIAAHENMGKRLTIDPQAMIISECDRKYEQGGLQKIATTGQGVGAANARKILNRGNSSFGSSVQLARDVEKLEPYIGNVREKLTELIAREKRILIEGTQGTMLGLHHGLYPHVTSRETSTAGCLSDAGIAPAHLDKVILVVRTYPIRVGGESGWLGREISYEFLSETSGIPIEQLKQTELGTVSRRQRRIAEFDWAQLRKSVSINGATEIALTFADYLGRENQEAGNFKDLNKKTRDFVEAVERVSGVPVSLISKAFKADGVLERKK